MAADVVGYSRLVEIDEAGTLAALRHLRQAVLKSLVAEHRGRLVKLMGDGLIAEFGSVVEAMACARAIQTQLAGSQEAIPLERRIVLRIGINVSDVVVEDSDLLGDGVNVAALEASLWTDVDPVRSWLWFNASVVHCGDSAPEARTQLAPKPGLGALPSCSTKVTQRRDVIPVRRHSAIQGRSSRVSI
jgi:hypothetical protein